MSNRPISVQWEFKILERLRDSLDPTQPSPSIFKSIVDLITGKK